MPNIKQTEFDIISQKINKIYPLLSLQVLNEDIRLQEGKTSRSLRKLYKYFLNERRSDLEGVLLRIIPVLTSKNLQELEKLFIFVNKYRRRKKIDSAELVKFLHEGLRFVEILSGVEERDWDELSSVRKQFFTKEIAPRVQDFRHNKIKYYLWLLKNCF